MRYNAFISYNHWADKRLAPALKLALHQFARPFYRPRALQVFLDQTNLAISPHLWPEIREAIRESDYFILLASPDAAQSFWVQKELEEWFTQGRTADHLLLVVTGGNLQWDREAGDFSWPASTAVPDVLRGRFSEEPLHLDLRWARGEIDLSLQHPVFVDAVASLAARLRRAPKDALVDEDLAQRRRLRKIALTAIAVLLALTLSTGTLAWLASRQAAAAESRELAARAVSALLNDDTEAAVEFAAAAVRRQPTAEAVQALRETLVALPIVAVLTGHRRRPLASVAFAPDGSHVITDDGWTWRIWRSETFSPIAAVDRPFYSNEIPSYSTDGSLFATAADSIEIWSTRTWKRVAAIPSHHIEPAVSFDRSGRLVSIVSWTDSIARLWSVPEGRLVRSLATGPATEAVFADGGRAVVTATVNVGPDRVGKVRVWDPATGRERFGRAAVVELLRRDNVSLSPDGLWIATRSPDESTVEIWSVRTGEVIRTLRRPGRFTSAVFSPRSLQVLTTDGSRVARVWDATRGVQEMALTGAPTGFFHAAFSPDGTRVVAQEPDGRSFVWNLQDGHLVGAVPRRGGGSMSDMNSDASLFVVPRGTVARIVRPSKLRDQEGTPQMDFGVIVLDSPFEESRRDGKVLSGIRWSPDSRYLAAMGGNVVDVWEANAARFVGRLSGHTGPVRYVRFRAGDSREVLTAGEDSTMILWHVDGRELERLTEGPVPTGFGISDPYSRGVAGVIQEQQVLPYADPGDHAAISSTGRLLAAVGEDGRVRVWDRRREKVISTLGRELTDVQYLEVSPDDRLLLVRTGSTYGEATVWNTRSGGRETALRVPGGVREAKFSPNGQFLAVIGNDDTLRLYRRPLFAPLEDLLALVEAFRL